MRYATPRPPRAHLIAAAESYAKVDDFADACYRYYYHQDDVAHKRLITLIKDRLTKYYLSHIPAKYHDAIITTALLELTYPLVAGRLPAFSERERAITAGISRQTFRKYGMSLACAGIIDDITGTAIIVADRIQRQLGKNFKLTT